MSSKRKASAMAATAADELVDPSDQLKFLCLGGGNEVGRSCHIVQYKNKTVMLDAGQHPAFSGFAALPFFDDFDLSTVDVLLISHFHVDHAASLPYVLAKTNFKGRVFMTHPTKAIYKWLIQDSVRVGNTSPNSTSQPVYTEQDHLNTFPMIEAIDYHTTHTISSIRITPYPAGHVLGAAMFLIEIAGLKVFFTGDYSREQDRHLVSAEVPRGVKIDVLITESTYGVASHVPRVEREQALMKSVTGILNRGGHCLMPVFALGRAQELLLVLDEYWSRHAEFQKYPIFYASSLARKCMLVYQTYVGAMNDNIKRLFRERMAEAEAAGDSAKAAGPWDFKHIRSLKNLDRFDDMGGCVMLAAPGMLQNGISRELLERWAPNEKNGVVITGYSVEGTMARHIMQDPDHIQAIMTRGGGMPGGGARRVPGASGEPDKIVVPRRCSVEEFSFAAHVDGTENREFIEEVNAPVVILVHGEQHNMMRLKSKLLSQNANKEDKTKVFSPRNGEELNIPFKSEKLAKVVGRLASTITPAELPNLPEPPIMSGVLVQNDFKLSIMAPEDLREYAGLNTTIIVCRQYLDLPGASIELMRLALEGTFDTVDDLPEALKATVDGNIQKIDDEDQSMEAAEDDENQDMEVAGAGDMVKADEDSKAGGAPRLMAAFIVMGTVKIFYYSSGRLMVEWEGNSFNDSIADFVFTVIMSSGCSPSAVRHSGRSTPHSHAHDEPGKTEPDLETPMPQQLVITLEMLEAQFGADAVSVIGTPRISAAAIAGSANNKGKDADVDMADVDCDDDLDEWREAELLRLHKLGIPVPGILVKFDKLEAKIWLEDLEVECNHKALADRIRAVMDRAADCAEVMWE